MLRHSLKVMSVFGIPDGSGLSLLRVRNWVLGFYCPFWEAFGGSLFLLSLLKCKL